jgi:hypothetical protein
MAITPTNSLLSALSNIGANIATDAVRPRPAPQAARAPAAAPAPPAATAAATAPEPGRPLPRGSLVNLVV